LRVRADSDQHAVDAIGLDVLVPAIRTEPAALELLVAMLRFSPGARCSTRDSLEHAYLARTVTRAEVDKAASVSVFDASFESLGLDLDQAASLLFEEVALVAIQP